MERKNGKIKDVTEVTPIDDSKKQAERGTWTNQVDFFLSCLGYAVGLGNLWRFPYLCYKNGGGAFLIPYVLMLTFCGLPLFYLELSLGQYSGVGPNILFKRLSPIFRGVGYGMLIVTFLVTLYYNMIMGWTFFYTFASFSSRLGWDSCENPWNTPNCFDQDQNADCLTRNLTFWNNTCYDPEQYCEAIPNFIAGNATHCINATAEFNSSNRYVLTHKATKRVSPGEEYYSNYVLGMSESFEDFGELRWQLVLCLLLAWIVVAACLIKGVKSSGKVVYFTALFPYVVLVILLIRGAMLEGAANGVYYYIVPKWEKLKETEVWGDAATQIFYSLGIGFGGLHTLSSYNSFKNNCYRDAITVAVANCSTSVFAGFVIFSILGFMAHTLGVPVEEVVASGQGLAFIAYPEAVTRMPVSQLWSFLFFFMVITLGLDSQFTMCETLITAVHDEWPSLRKHKSTAAVVICIALFLLGLPMCARGGVYLFTLLDSYSAGWSLLIITFIECLVVAWNYGIRRYSGNIKEMIGMEPNYFWKGCWCVISPTIMLGILIFSLVMYAPARYGSYVFPRWANQIGWGMAIISVSMIPIFAIFEIIRAIREQRPLRTLFIPTIDWETQNKERNKESQLPVTLQPGAQATYDNPSFRYSTDM